MGFGTESMAPAHRPDSDEEGHRGLDLPRCCHAPPLGHQPLPVAHFLDLVGPSDWISRCTFSTFGLDLSDRSLPAHFLDLRIGSLSTFGLDLSLHLLDLRIGSLWISLDLRIGSLSGSLSTFGLDLSRIGSLSTFGLDLSLDLRIGSLLPLDLSRPSDWISASWISPGHVPETTGVSRRRPRRRRPPRTRRSASRTPRCGSDRRPASRRKNTPLRPRRRPRDTPTTR